MKTYGIISPDEQAELLDAICRHTRLWKKFKKILAFPLQYHLHVELIGPDEEELELEGGMPDDDLRK